MSFPDSPPPTPQRSPSPAGSFTTIHSSEAGAYFQEEGGRRFAAVDDHPITLPMDSAEADRLNGQHMALKILLGKNWFGPLETILQPSHPADQRKRVLDVCSSPGLWAQEMSVEFPTGVKFIGLDVAPSAKHYPKDNLAFDIYNFPKQGFNYSDASFDAVHARGIITQIRDIPNLLLEVKRILRPGGIFLFGEIELTSLTPSGLASGDTPGMDALYDQFRRAVEAQGIRVDGTGAMGQWLEAVGGFQPAVQETYLFPVGGQWLSPPHSRLKEVGRLMLQNMQRLGMSMKPALIRSGLSPSQVESMVENFQTELSDPSLRIHHQYHTVYAIKD